jgi:16S rRNA (guanine966-N2)-methyltransferase
MRIIAGVAKGRTLSTVSGATRPTSDRAREGLFSSLTSEFGDFLGLHVLDLFAGSGAVGFEALSRGATLVHGVENESDAIKTITTNSEIVDKARPTGKFHLYSMSVERFVSDPAHDQYHLVYIDPPYDLPSSQLEEILRLLAQGNFLKSDAFIAVERRAKGGQFTWPQSYEPVRERNYGQATIYYANAARITPENG